MSLTEIADGLYLDEEGRFIINGGGAPLMTYQTSGHENRLADLSVHGSLAAHAINGEHQLSNDWIGQNVLCIHSQNAAGSSAIRFRMPGNQGQECGAIGAAFGDSVFGPRGTMYFECSNFLELDKYGTYRGVQTKYGYFAVREEWKENGDIVLYDRSTPERAVLTITATGDLIVGDAITPTDATNRFLHFPTCHGKPSGIPEATAEGRSPVVFDELNNVLWFYNRHDSLWRGTDMPYPLPADRVPDPFVPSGVDPLSLGLDFRIDNRAAAYVTDAVPASNGQSLYRINDLAGSNHVVQATAGARLTYDIVGGKRSFVSSAGKRMDFVSPVEIGGDRNFVFQIAANIAAGSVDQIVAGDYSTQSQLRIGASLSKLWINSTAAGYESSDECPCVGAHVWTFRVVEGVVSFYVDGVAYGSAAWDSDITLTSLFAHSSGEVPLLGNVYAMSLKIGTLTDPQLADLLAYDSALLP